MVDPTAETVAIWLQTRKLGRTPSLFIEDFQVNEFEEWLEVWLYRHDFRPVWDNFLGKVEILEGVSADILNEYYFDQIQGFATIPARQRQHWTWGHVAGFASRIKHIKRFVRKR
jgi:hypothetical protein